VQWTPGNHTSPWRANGTLKWPAAHSNLIADGPDSVSFKNQFAGSQFFKKLQNVVCEGFCRSVIFNGESLNELFDRVSPVAEFPDSAADFIERIIVSIMHVEQKEIV
jgi:hypothetical protein